MSIIVSASGVHNIRIAYSNLFESATVTASSEADGFPKEAAYNWNTASYWKPTATGTEYLYANFGTAQIANYFAFYAHNLPTYTAQVKLQYSTDGGSSWSDACSYQMPSTSRPVLVEFDDITASDWRVALNSPTGPAQLGVVAFGEAFKLPFGPQLRGFTPPTMGRENEYLNNTAEGGQFLGRRLLRNGAMTQFNYDVADPDWVRDSWMPFIEHAEKKPFFFSWDAENHASEVAFCFTDGDIQSPSYNLPFYMKVGLKMKALIV